jgi:membrane protease YdiL (CAAX protease family)
MLINSFKHALDRWSLLRTFSLPVWVLVGFLGSQLVIVSSIILLRSVGLRIGSVESVVFNAVLAALIYGLSLGIIVGVPWLLWKSRTTKQELGLTRLPSWMDILLAPAGLVIYFVLSATFISLFARLVSEFDVSQIQNIPFTNLSQKYEYLLAFSTLVVLAPLAEETLFRGYLYGKLRKFTSIWMSMLVTSVLFGVVHGQFNVAIDVFALSIIACSLREITGNIWAGVLLHMMKNGIAFYVLFINPSLLHTIGS